MRPVRQEDFAEKPNRFRLPEKIKKDDRPRPRKMLSEVDPAVYSS